jgi:hypothetical protein
MRGLMPVFVSLLTGCEHNIKLTGRESLSPDFMLSPNEPHKAVCQRSGGSLAS